MQLFSRKSIRFGPANKKSMPYAEPVKRLLSYQAANIQGVGTRTGQEDSFAFVNAMDVTRIREQGLLALMADGMGGMADGKLVSNTAVSLLLEEFQKMDRSRDMARQLRESIYRANDALNRQFRGNGGTTLVACIFYRERLYLASVGDSCIYLKRESGIFRLNREQNWRQELYVRATEEGNLDPSWADADPDRMRLSEFLGKAELGDVDAVYRPWMLQDGDTLLLCSDGVGGVLTEQMLYECLSRKTPEQACACMEQKIREQGRVHQDNYTALVIMCRY